MSLRARRAAALLCCATLSGCGDGSGIRAIAGFTGAATVRFVNATATPLDLFVDGTVTVANIAPGLGLGCFSVNDPTLPGLSVRQSGTTTDLGGFPPSFAVGGPFTVVAYPGLSGLIQFISIPNASPPITGRSALRVFHGSLGLGMVDVYLSAPGAVLGTPAVAGLTFGAVTSSLDAAAGAAQVRLTSAATTTVVFDSGNQPLEAGKSYTLVVSSATSAILVPDC
jgi:hypothetical protein